MTDLICALCLSDSDEGEEVPEAVTVYNGLALCRPCFSDEWDRQHLGARIDGTKHHPGCRAEDGFPCQCARIDG